MNWKCQVSGNIYPQGDPRLAGYGNPPRTPLEPGMGGCPMIPTFEKPKESAETKGSALAAIVNKEETPNAG